MSQSTAVSTCAVKRTIAATSSLARDGRVPRTRAPKGFDPQHPALDLIKKKDWILDVSLDPSLATTPKLYGEILDRFRAIAPLIEYLNRPLAGRKPPREPIEAHF